MTKFTFFNKLFFTLLTLLIFGVGFAWAGNVTLKATAEASPSTQGFVYVAKSNSAPSSYTLTSDYASETKFSVGTNWIGYLTVSQDFYLFASAKDGYGFTGWSKNSSDTSGDTSNPKSITVSGKNSGTVTDGPYYAHFSPVTVNSVDPAATSLTFTKPETKSVTLTFNVSNADAKADFNTPVISNTTDWTLKSWNYSNNSITVVVTMTVTNATDKTANHNTTVTLSSKGTSDNQSKQATINVTVDMNPQFTCNIKNTYLVDDAINLASSWTSTSNGAISYSLEQFTPSGTNNEGATAPYIGTDNKLHFGQAGIVALKLTQAASVSFNGGSTTKTITINKRENSIAIAGIDDTDHEIPQIKTDWYDNEITLTADNKDYTNRPIHNERTQGTDDQASFGQQEGTTDKWVVYTGQNVGVVTWRVWQEENYKYKAAENTFSIEVVAPPCGCILKQQTWSSSFKQPVGDIGLWDFGGEAGEALSFELRSNGAAGNHMTYTLVTDGQDEDPVKLKAKSELYFSSVGTITLGEGEHNTTAVKFAKSSITPGLNTDNPYVHNIVVTRKRWFKVQNAESTEITSLPDMIRTVGDDALTATFNVDFSTCDSEVKVASNHDNVTFANNDSRYTISTNPAEDKSKGYKDQKTVTLTYTSDTIEDKIVTITIYTQYENKTLTLHVKTIGKEAKIVYVGNASYPVNNANIPASQLFEVRDKNTNAVIPGATVTLSGSSEAASVVNNGLHPLCGDKSVNISAAFAGDKTHEPSVLATPQTIAITKIEDAVSFNSHPTVFIGKSYDISGWASANTLIASYTSSDNAIFSISGTTLTANAVGTETLTATASGDECTYISGATNSESITVQPGYIFNGTNNDQWEVAGNWENGDKPTGTEDVIIRGNLVIDDDIEVNSMTIENTGSVTLAVTGSLTVGSGNSMTLEDGYGNLHVQNGGQVNLTTGKLYVNDFILDAKLGDSDTKKAASGQVVAPEMLSINHKAYFQMTFDPEGAISYGWYDFTVPFEVNINGGISRINSAADKVMVCGTDFLIMEADEQNRANGGKGWRQLHGGVMNPGKLYTIGFDDGVNQNTFLFAWNGNGNLTNGNSYAACYATGGDGSKNGWNGLGNGMMRHGYPNCSYKKQAYNHKDNIYNLVDGNVTFAVGSAFFIQVPAAGSLAWVEDMADARPVFAPKHEVEQVEECRLTLRDENDKQVDVLYYSASEEATDAYVIGKDLLKLGTPTEAKVAQMWATKGGKKLCDIEAALVNDNAVAPLSLFTPKAGEYMLSVEQMPEDATLYLTYNDQVIWDLTQGAYMFVLEKGTTEGYGLSFQAKRAPQVTTGMENTNADSHSVRKVLINNTIYIITPEGEMYNIMGKNIQ